LKLPGDLGGLLETFRAAVDFDPLTMHKILVIRPIG
jgi:hypothetical protein